MESVWDFRLLIEIIQSHKGKIEVESKYNKGTKFIIRLPIINNKK